MFASASLLDPTWQIKCSRLTLSGPWWDHSWYSGAPWFSVQHYGDQLVSRDWTTSSSQPRSLTLAQSSTPTLSTNAAPQLPLKLIVSTHTSGLSLDASTQTIQHCPLSLRTLPSLLPHTVPPPQTPPHNSRSPSSFLGASFPKTRRFTQSLYVTGRC